MTMVLLVIRDKMAVAACVAMASPPECIPTLPLPPPLLP